ncbi:MAG: hypothetical protein WC305_05865 [Bacteroidales bacterium]|jgi:asparagine synthetase B (glutamine-hydrolysing)
MAVLSCIKAVGYPDFIPQTQTEGAVALGYCYHSGRQPKAGIYNSNDICLVADIRIYNEEKLQKEFNFSSPEEAFEKAYLKWGGKCADHINEDFSAVVFDKKKKEGMDYS